MFAEWVSDSIRKLQDQPDMIINSFSACGISDTMNVRPAALQEGQEYPDSDEENPFGDEMNELEYEI